VSYLRIGTPRRKVRPPRVTPCSEPLIYGSNILRDPGIEYHLANTGGGPLGDEIPGYYGALDPGCTPEIAWTNGTYGNPGACAYSSSLGWAHASVGSQKPWAWRVDTVDPRSGTYHLKCLSYDDVGSGNHNLYVVGGNPCISLEVFYLSGHSLWYSARVASGNYVRFGGYIKQTPLTFGAATWEMCFTFYDGTGSELLDTCSTTYYLDSTYTWYEFATFAPTDAYYLFITCPVHWYSPTPSSAEVYGDDFVLELRA